MDVGVEAGGATGAVEVGWSCSAQLGPALIIADLIYLLACARVRAFPDEIYLNGKDRSSLIVTWSQRKSLPPN